ncbi:MAG: 3-beta hydroxysteroid dehydrogenase [Deltaproteobacteria bacterium]|nr:MAG: 3-beta hydroxysteroid dehydrogenase [Deltaproteobacteria bacterium]
MRNILVTGGGGFLGKAIVKRLLDQGDRVRSFSRKTYADLTALNVSQIQGDLADAAAVSRAVAGMDVVFHVAALPGVWGPYDAFYRTNELGTRNIITACRTHRVQRLVYTSSPSVIFDGSDMEGVNESVPYPKHHPTHYSRTKAAAEKFVMAAGNKDLPTISLRPHLIWGPGDNHLVPRILARARQLVQVGDGKNRVDTLYIDNAASAHLLAEKALERNPNLSGNTYFISQDDPIPVWDMINQILAAGGKPAIEKKMSHTTVRLIGGLLEGIWRLGKLPGEPPMTRFVADELATAHWFDISAAKRDFGFYPEISTAEGLQRLAAYLAADSGRF